MPDDAVWAAAPEANAPPSAAPPETSRVRRFSVIIPPAKVERCYPFDSGMKIILVLAGLVLAVFLVDRVLLWMEWRGWIDYRRTYPGRINTGQVGPAFLAIQGLLEPEKRHAAEEQTALRTERDSKGDQPKAGAER